MTLPTRTDGGIDWSKVMLIVGVHKLPNGLGEMGAAAFETFGKEIATHTRERCAKWHDDQKRYWMEIAKTFPTQSASEQYAEERASDHEDYAAELRKMEV